jgi:hypothetical protein
MNVVTTNEENGMKKIKIAPWFAGLAVMAAILACSLPAANQTDPNALSTSVAQTVVAQISASPQPALVTVTVPAGPGTQTPVQLATLTPLPLLPTVTNTSQPCNAVQFVNDVTIPDGTNLLNGSSFTKTWRLKNTGSCTWSTSYNLVFDHGDSMGGPAAQALVAATPPGGTVDISVNLTAPGSAGTYKGFWKLRDQNGGVFGLGNGPFWVEIISVPPTATVTATAALAPPVGMITAPLVAAETGSVRSNGVVFTFANVGDTETNIGQQGFLSFDISALPAGATVLDVKMKFSDYDALGNPWSLGCLRMYQQDFGATVDAADYVGGATLGALERWCSAGELSTLASAAGLKTAIQSAVGSPRIRVRMQFNENATNNNGVGDMLRFGPGLQLQISYTVP